LAFIGRGCETAFSDALVFEDCGFVGCDVQTVWVDVDAAAAEVVDNEATDFGSGWGVCDRKAARKLLRNGLWVGITQGLCRIPVCVVATEGVSWGFCFFDRHLWEGRIRCF